VKSCKQPCTAPGFVVEPEWSLTCCLHLHVVVGRDGIHQIPVALHPRDGNEVLQSNRGEGSVHVTKIAKRNALTLIEYCNPTISMFCAEQPPE
jgi:hypothetical protein